VNKALDLAAASYGRDWMAHVRRNATVQARNSAHAVSLVKSGEADAAIVLHADALGAGEEVKVIPIPAELNAPLVYWAWTNSAASDRKLADDFIEYLFSHGNQRRLEAAGFSSVLSSVAEIPVHKPDAVMRLFTAGVPALPQATINSGGRRITGASVRSILEDARGRDVIFTAADEQRLVVPLAQVRRTDAVLESMTGGNYRVVLPSGVALRWIRRIEVR
jgi:ABC-type glycerol-3-phosphate transport system substrate-binding protein